MSDFPDYANGLGNFSQLKQLAPLSNVKVICLQTDLATRKHYVGSSSGNSNGLWQRWMQYAKGDHAGGDVDLIIVVKEKGNNKVKIIFNIQYSILEIFDTRVDFDSVIYLRKEFWKQTLDTRVHDYDKN
ncbi:hypothetical protein [Enterococcus sp. AZ103]|uniref:hypothetical protein n=1 Tax=Enterococcus sp. AZ103 TaxID=2774628 RepID=UPI003F684D49